jgi:hypothetical protein
LPRGTIDTFWTLSTVGKSSERSAWPASCQATTRFSWSVITLRD